MPLPLRRIDKAREATIAESIRLTEDRINRRLAKGVDIADMPAPLRQEYARLSMLRILESLPEERHQRLLSHVTGIWKEPQRSDKRRADELSAFVKSL